MEQQNQKSWFSKNWGWVLGGGCLTFIVIIVLAIGGFVYKVFDSVKESEPYMHALVKSKENEQVVGFLGEPIETNGLGSSTYNYKNGLSIAELIIPIKGPRDEGSIVVTAEKVSDEWSYIELYVKIDGETEHINLLETDNEAALDDL